jgi:small subunit ribosomal protein S15
MATLYGHGKGRARSHPPKAEKPYWVTLNSAEIEALVVKLSKEGYSTAKIGVALRDNYGIPNVQVITGKKVEKILIANGIAVEKQDMQALMLKEKKLQKHFEKNKKDYTAKRGLQLTKAKVKRLKDYSS